MESKLFLLGLLCLLGVTYAEDVVLNNHKIPDDVSLGVATAAFQIEGAWNESGKGENMWDWFMHTYPDKIENKGNGDVACDSYHQWDKDIALLKELGVSHYRLSISWSRILPEGIPNQYTINQEGVDYYRTILKALNASGITPYVTLYHWDLPLPLHQLGGWMNPIVADHFAEYARICYQKFGDLVKNWFTLNEPQTYCVLGYATGEHAPGFTLPEEGIYKCARNSILAHAKAYRIYDQEFRAQQGGRVSIVINTAWNEPASKSEKDKEAAKRENAFQFGLYADPIYLGNWPKTVIDTVDKRSQLENFPSSRLPKFSDDEIKLINGSSDFFALNTYSTFLVAHKNKWDENINVADVSFFNDKGTTLSVNPSWPSNVDWVHLVPSGFRSLLNYVHKTYGHPEIFVAENGWADKTGTITDKERKTYIQQYLSALLDAKLTDGVNVTGYTVWSLLDNLEWAHGYTQKLGLVQVDFNKAERPRTKKDSFSWYKSAIQNRCILDDATKCVK